ncbi:ABC transporter substrate-binding protein [Streptomyces sp. NRRL B-1347]|uniref:ABC transporter substrate-binding protein n=1 Tax=Streptomyces sp. NRRL B-1347 TaxID=1476877 RepID=UPI0004C60FD0|nr:ABC transporter substrate-binding protein [Streptomyces sp. NRRL B-1347]
MRHRSLTVGVFSPSVLLRVARAAGLFDQHGLTVTEVPVASSPAQFRDLFDGAVDAAFTSPDNVIAYRFAPDNPLGRTGDVRILAALDRGLGLGVYAAPGVKGADELRGAAAGVDVPDSGFAFGLYAVLESLGLKAPCAGPGDYQVVALGSTPRRLAALLDGRCAATVLGAGSELRAEAAGAVRLAGLTEVCGPYLGTVLTAVGPRRARAAHALTSALAQTSRLIVSGVLDGLVLEQTRAAFRLPDDLAARYAARLRDPAEGLVPDGAADRAALDTVLGLRLRYRPGDAALATALDPARGLLDPQAC